MSRKGILFVVSGPSGCGKGTIMKELLASMEHVFLSTSATTRAPRPGEVDGEHYFFLSQAEFQHEIEHGGMLEHACYCENYYGTPKKPVFDQLAQGEDIILEIEVQGAMQVCKEYPETVSIFVMPPSLQELQRRLIDRNTEDPDTIARRLHTALEEMKLAENYDYIVINDSLSEAVKDVAAIICAEKNSLVHMQSFLAEITEQTQ